MTKIISINDFFILTKFKLSFAVSLSCLFTFVLYAQELNKDSFIPFLAVLLLALGVSCLNQVQEYKEDALMIRTQNRPIASKRVTATQGAVISFILIFLAFALIYISNSYFGLALFALVVILYNVFYTNAKKTTIYAAVYGAVLGVIPPLIGWVSAGGEIYDIRFQAIALFYFVWQIPHFWLLTLKYHKQYKKAKFPTVIDRFGVEGLERITSIWLLLTVICGMFMILVFYPLPIYLLVLLLILNVITVVFIFLLRKNHKYLMNFMLINSYLLFSMILLMINSFI